MEPPNSIHIVGRYINGEVKVITYWQGKGWCTEVESPHLYSGRKSMVEYYSTMYEKAMLGHDHYVSLYSPRHQSKPLNLLPPPSKEEKPKKIKISIQSLFRILYEYQGDEDILVTSGDNNPLVLNISLHKGRRAGSCSYDLIENEAFDISSSWTNLILDWKKDIIDHRDSKDKNELDNQVPSYA